MTALLTPTRRNDLFDNLFTAWRDAATAPHAIAIDVVESAEAYTVKAELPGARKEDVTITVHDETLKLEVEFKREPATEDTGKVVWSERRAGRASRSLAFPYPVNAEAAKAQFENGVLTLTLPKNAAHAPRTISIV